MGICRALCFTFCLILIAGIDSIAQLRSGTYSDGLNIVFNHNNKSLKGYYYAEGGYDEKTQRALFSCGFYFLSTPVSSTTYNLKTFWPGDKSADTILGTLVLIDSSSFNIKLNEEHGGCWNVFHFADSLVKFELSEKKNWMDIRYVIEDKIYFRAAADEKQIQQAYLVKNDIVYIEKQIKDWVFCSYIGTEKNTKGWLKLSELNP